MIRVTLRVAGAQNMKIDSFLFVALFLRECAPLFWLEIQFMTASRVCEFPCIFLNLAKTNQADRLAKRLPSGKAFVCLDTKKIPEILKTIFTSTMLK